MDTERRLDYYNALEESAVKSDLSTFSTFIVELEEKQPDEYLKLCKTENK